MGARLCLFVTVVLVIATSSVVSGGLLPFQFGPRAGINITDIIADGIDSKPAIGFVGGAFVRITFGEVGLQPEILYTGKGYGVDVLDIKIRLDYIEIPLLLTYEFSMLVNAKTRVLLGPAVSFNTRADSDGIDIEDMVESTVYNIVAGLEFDFPVSRGNLVADLRATVGVSDTFDKSHPQVFDGNRNINISLGLGYTF